MCYRWRCPGLRSGILNVVILAESDDEGLVSSVTPVPVLPYDAAKEMREICEKTFEQELQSNALLSNDQMTDDQKSELRQAIWHDHIRSFAVDLDFLLNDMDEEREDDASDEEMDTALLKVFRSLYEFLKTWNAQRTIEFLIQACKERGVISFYSECPEATDERSEQPALYRSAPKFLDGSDVEDEENNEFMANFTSDRMEQDGGSSMARLSAFSSFEAFAEAGTFRAQLDDDDGPSTPNNEATLLESPSQFGYPRSVKVESDTVNVDCYVTICIVVCMFICFTRGYERKEPYIIFGICLFLVARIYNSHRCHCG